MTAETGPVLIVEDDDPIRESLVDALEATGYRAVSASNGEEALRVLRDMQPLPCLVLLDLMMPVLDGAGFRSQQLSDPALAAIPVFVLSAYADAAVQARRMGANGFFKKPVELRRVLDIVRAHCRPS